VSAAGLLSELRRRDIELRAVGGELRCSAPAGALTPELREALRRHKDDVLKLLASAAAVAAQARAIVPLQAAGPGIPVFAVPGHNGDVFCFRALAQCLGSEHPFYGLQPPGLDGAEAPLERVEELAAYFASQVNFLRLDGPYIIAGYCAGGSIALELARRLQAAGAAIHSVALFGAPFPSYFRWPAQLAVRAAHETRRVLTHCRALATQSWRAYFERKLREREKRLAAQPAQAGDPVLERRAQVERATLSAVRRYRPKYFEGTLNIFHPSRQWLQPGVGALRWRKLATAGEDYFGPHGCRRPEMLREGNAPVFADLFRRCYGRVGGRSEGD
jgi:thioesterase domain-containing protein